VTIREICRTVRVALLQRGCDQTMGKAPGRFTLWMALAAFALVAVVGLALYRQAWLSDRRSLATADLMAIGGPFNLLDHTGRAVTERDFAGKLLLVYFGYTYCPNLCPTALALMGQAIDLLGDGGAPVVPLFFTLDPARDTPEQLQMYVGYFHPRLVGLTGSPEHVAAAARAYQIHFDRLPGHDGDDEDYLLDHTAIIYLMGRDGRFRAHFSLETPPAAIAARIREYL
jgi:protein SCO1/2